MGDDTSRAGEQAEGPWTEEEAAAFAQALVTFRDGLPPPQRAAFTAILAAAAAQGDAGGDVQGYSLVVPMGLVGDTVIGYDSLARIHRITNIRANANAFSGSQASVPRQVVA